MDHFENLLHKFLQLEDTLLLEKLLKVCKEKSDFTALFPVLVKSGVSWTILKPAWQDYFNMAGIENGTEFLQKVHNFSFYILDVDCSRDQDRQELNVATFTGMVEKFKVLQDGETFSDIYEEMSVLGNIFIIAEVLGYNLFKFNKSLSGIFIKQVFCSSNMHPNKVGVVWVRLVTDLYSCTNLLENWEEDAEEYEDLDECAFFVRYFEVVERVGADIKGILGDAKKYGDLVKALSRYANFHEDESDSDDGEDVQEEVGALPKFWVPFVTLLQARIEALLPPESDKITRNDNNSDLPYEPMELLKVIRKLLASVKRENAK